ncbi:hypothetical protein HMP0015_2757 [Acinetobacter haemolyticus ATCC 19194]|uniref:Uncharacterized protein n=1 Tax=Acinetobacter haemolyticus ATCC 19194 TaxID=707232 RepID=D4XSR5_ACIHA|nr:hypothetical protein HMP0015_2757 [Acinetobacter haemolyticus ATCC 19194]
MLTFFYFISSNIHSFQLKIELNLSISNIVKNNTPHFDIKYK